MKASFALAALALTLSAAVSAQTPPAPPAPSSPPAATPAPATPPAPVRDFATRKSHALAHIDRRMAAMTTMRSCVSAAATSADLDACRPAKRGRMHHPKPAPT